MLTHKNNHGNTQVKDLLKTSRKFPFILCYFDYYDIIFLTLNEKESNYFVNFALRGIRKRAHIKLVI